MEREIEKIKIVKEGIYYTLYINDCKCGCGDLRELIDELDEYINISFIIAYENEFGDIDVLINKRGSFLQFYTREKAEKFVKDNYYAISDLAGVLNFNYEIREWHSDFELGKEDNVWRGY